MRMRAPSLKAWPFTFGTLGWYYEPFSGSSPRSLGCWPLWHRFCPAGLWSAAPAQTVQPSGVPLHCLWCCGEITSGSSVSWGFCLWRFLQPKSQELSVRPLRMVPSTTHNWQAYSTIKPENAKLVNFPQNQGDARALHVLIRHSSCFPSPCEIPFKKMKRS